MPVVIWAIMKVENKPESCCHFFPFLDCEKSLFFLDVQVLGPVSRKSRPDNQCARKAVVVFKQNRGFNSLAFNISHQLGKQNAVVC